MRKTDACEMVQDEVKWRIVTSDVIIGHIWSFKIRSKSVMGSTEEF